MNLNGLFVALAKLESKGKEGSGRNFLRGFKKHPSQAQLFALNSSPTDNFNIPDKGNPF